MTDALDELLNSETDGRTAGGKLREQLEAALNESKALKEQMVALQAESRTRAVKDLAGKHGIPDLALDFFPKDAALTDEAATAFVEKYGQLWGVQATQATTPPEQQQAASTAQAYAAQANALPSGPMNEEQYKARFAEASTRDEFLKMLAELEPTATLQVMGDE